MVRGLPRECLQREGGYEVLSPLSEHGLNSRALLHQQASDFRRLIGSNASRNAQENLGAMQAGAWGGFVYGARLMGGLGLGRSA